MLSRLEDKPGDEAVATSFNRSIVELAKQPSVEVFELLREIANHPFLAHARDVHGWPCRAAVLWTWSELGYPFALELSAEDLAYVRENAHGSAGGWLSLTFGLSAISALLYGAAFLLVCSAMLIQNSFGGRAALGLALLGAMMAHALATLSATRAAQAQTASAGGWLRALSKAGWVVVVGAVLLGLVSEEAGVVTFVVGLPVLASSLSAGVAASGLIER